MRKIFIILLSCFLVFGCSKKVEQKENDIVNIYQDVIKKQEVDNFVFEETTVIYSNNTTNFRVKIKNIGNSREVKNVIVKFKSSNDILIKEFKIPVMKIIEQNKTEIITMSTDIDLTNAYKVTYELE